MDRINLYRGMNVETKKWVYGSFFIQIMPIIGTKRCFIKDVCGYDCAVIRESVGEFTGKQLGDAKIFEGDVDFHGNEVIWSETSLGWFVKKASTNDEEPLYSTFFKQFTNIHEMSSLKNVVKLL